MAEMRDNDSQNYEAWMKEGYTFAIKNQAAAYSAEAGREYVRHIQEAIDILTEDMNRFKGFQTSSSMLQGDLAEFWHADTFNINAAINESSYKAYVNRSHGLGSPDVTLNDGTQIGLKYYYSAMASANAQAKSYFQRFCEYKASSGQTTLTMDQYLTENGIKEEVLRTDPIYSGQIRLIPSDQYEAAVEYLKWKIQKELMTRPEEAKRYQETLDLLTSNIKVSDGTKSVELSRETSQKMADLAKDGKFDPSEFGITTGELMIFSHALKEGVKAGTSAAVITMILKMAPHLYQCLEKLIRDGQLDEEKIYDLGFAALTGAGQGFMRGFVAGTIVTACKTGICGAALKSMNPSIVGALTAIFIQSMEDSFRVVKGDMTQHEFVANLSKNIFVSSCGIGVGFALSMITICPFAYLLGNFVGSFVGSFAYIAVDKAFISFAVYSGWTFFGVVKQNYILPDNVIEELGIDLFDYEKMFFEEYQFDKFNFEELSLDEYIPDFISIIRRGVIGIHQVGYVEN